MQRFSLIGESLNLTGNKQVEIEIYSAKAKGRRFHGAQWDFKAMSYLHQLGAEKAVEASFRKYFLNAQSSLIVGIGSGGDALRLAPYVKVIVGIDIAKPLLLKIKDSMPNRCLLVLCDAEKLPFMSEAFETLVCRATLHHLPNTLIALDELFRVLKRSGTMLLHEPGLLNPIAMIGRKFFPTNIHTPGERSFVPMILREKVSLKFRVMEMNYYYLLSHLLPIFWKYLINGFKEQKVISQAYFFDELLLRTPMKQLCWEFLLVAKKENSSSKIEES